MKYHNIKTGTIVEPADGLPSASFRRSSDWEPFFNDKPLSKLKNDELEALATKLEVDLSGAKNNNERVALVNKAMKGNPSEGSAG